MNFRIPWVSDLVWIVTIVGLCSVPPAQGAATPVGPDFTIQSWDSEDGLPATRLYALARTPDGYLWIGSEVGLVRFDGARFVTLTTNTVPALGHNHILSLLADTNGVLWVGTAAGTLASCVKGVFSAVPLEASLRGAPITHLSAGTDEALWLAFAGRGIIRRQGNTWDFSTPTNGLPPATAVTSFVAEPAGRNWAQVGEMLLSLREGNWQSERFDFAANTSVYAIAPDRGNHGLWLAVSASNPLPKHGARVFKVKTDGLFQELDPYPWSQDSQRNWVTAMLEDHRGRLWVGTWVNGVYYWDAEHGWRQPKTILPVSWHPVDALLEDEDGTVWVTTRDGSLHRLVERKVAVLSPPEGAGDFMITTACVTRDQTIWVGTDDAGVFRYEEGGFVAVTNGLSNLHIGVLLEDSRTNLWVGTWQGLYRWDGDRFHPVLGTDARGFRVYALYEDTQGNLWGGSNSRGLFKRTPDGKVRYYGRESGLDYYYVRAITQDAGGRICLAVWERGFYRLVDDKFEKFTAERWPGLRFLHGLQADPAGGMWIATEGAGVFHFNEGQFRQWNSTDGLPDTLLRTVIADEDGNLWFSSNRGIFGCAPEALLRYEGRRGSPILFWRVSVRDGLPGKLASGAGQPVAARSADGRLWFPNSRALAGFDPVAVRQTGRTFDPIIEGVLADGQVCEPDAEGGVRLRSGVRRLEFFYTCADLRAPERLRFRHWLEGLDEGWTDAGVQRVAHYGRLAPGTYRFRVMAGGATGEWREAEAALALIIVPRWWEQTWVLTAGVLLGLLLSGGTVWLVAHLRHRRRLAHLQLQQARESERRRIARDIHDDLGATLTRMLWMGEMATSPEAAQTQMRKVANTAREMSQSLEAIVWAVRPENDTLRSLIAYLGRRMDELFEGANTAYQFVAPPELPDRMVFAEARHNVFLACKEALTNALKHSQAREVRLEVTCVGDECQITITDDGRGFDPHGACRAGAAGLKNMEARMQEINGRFALRSEPGKGTTVRLSFPIPASEVD